MVSLHGVSQLSADMMTAIGPSWGSEVLEPQKSPRAAYLIKIRVLAPRLHRGVPHSCVRLRLQLGRHSCNLLWSRHAGVGQGYLPQQHKALFVPGGLAGRVWTVLALTYWGPTGFAFGGLPQDHLPHIRDPPGWESCDCDI